MSNTIKVGDKVYTRDEKRPYTVRACDDRYVICTKPFNLMHTMLYFIIDLKEMVRGTDSHVFCFGYETDEQCQEELGWLQDGRMEISHRNRVPVELKQLREGVWSV